MFNHNAREALRNGVSGVQIGNVEANDNPYHPPDILLGPMDEQGEWARVRRGFWRWQIGLFVVFAALGFFAAQSVLGIPLGIIPLLYWQELASPRFRQFAISAIKGRRPGLELATLPFVGVAALPTSARLGRGSDYVGYLRIGDEVELHLQDRDCVIANSAIRAVKQVRIERDIMSGLGVRAVQITFVESHGGVRQIVLMGKAPTVFGMKRASNALYQELAALVPEKMFSL